MFEIVITAIGASLIAVVGNIIMFKMQRKAIKEDKDDTKLLERIESQEKEQELIKDGLMSLLHDRLYRECTMLIKEGSVSHTELSNIEHLYKSYHSLGGNSTGTELYNRTKSLPIKIS